MSTSAMSQRARVFFVACLAIVCSHPVGAQEEAAATADFQGPKVCASCSEAVQPVAVESPRAGAARKAIRAALDSSTTVEFIQTPLHDIMLFLIDTKGIQIVIDDRALDELGIADDTPVDVELRDISLRAALEHLLRPFDLTFVIWNEVLLITSVDQALEGSYQTVRVYPVADLLRKTDGGALEYDVLVNTITTLIEPDSWRDAGGTGDIEPIAGTLVVSQTDQVHERIERLLCILRDVGRAELSPRQE